jgi:hypothetical protein
MPAGVLEKGIPGSKAEKSPIWFLKGFIYISKERENAYKLSLFPSKYSQKEDEG